MDQRFAKQVGGIAEKVAGPKGIGAVDDDVVAIEQLHRIAFIDGRLDRLELDVRIQRTDRPCRAVDLGPVQAVHRVDDLALEIGQSHVVVVGEPDGAHPRGRQV